MYDAKVRVAAGMAYLDDTNPDWELSSKFAKPVNVAHEQCCPLALLDDVPYPIARAERRLSLAKAQQFGFFTRSGDGPQAIHEYAALSAEWNARIAERRKLAEHEKRAA